MANTATRTASSSKLTRARLIGTLVMLVFLLIVWRSGARWAALPLLVGLIAYHFVLPRLVFARVNRFNKEAIALLTSGHADKIPSLAGRSVFLQMFAPAPALSAKLALAYVELGDYRSACAAFETALQDPTPTERLPLELGYAKALFVCGKTSQAAKIAGRLLKQGVRLPELFVFVARDLMERGDHGKQTRSSIEQALELSGSPESCAMARLASFEQSLHSKKTPRPTWLTCLQPLCSSWDGERCCSGSQKPGKANKTPPATISKRRCRISTTVLSPRSPKVSSPSWEARKAGRSPRKISTGL